MISANNVTLRIGKKALFEDVNIKFTEGNCYGLIGANGAGKSTFLKILSGKLETTKGDVSITPGQRLSVLEQDHFKYDEFPVLDAEGLEEGPGWRSHPAASRSSRVYQGTRTLRQRPLPTASSNTMRTPHAITTMGSTSVTTMKERKGTTAIITEMKRVITAATDPAFL